MAFNGTILKQNVAIAQAYVGAKSPLQSAIKELEELQDVVLVPEHKVTNPVLGTDGNPLTNPDGSEQTETVTVAATYQAALEHGQTIPSAERDRRFAMYTLKLKTIIGNLTAQTLDE